jgi:hypothetical protein
MAARNWTPEQRREQAERIKAWRPWEQSTGPRTAEGKAAAAQNAYSGGHRQMMRELGKALRAQRKGLDEFA